MQIYFNDKESDFVKAQEPGFVRRLVQSDMGEENKTLQNDGLKKLEGVYKKGDGLHTCKKCGYLLPFYKGKCKNC